LKFLAHLARFTYRRNGETGGKSLMQKKLVFVIVMLLIGLLLTACGDQTPTQSAAGVAPLTPSNTPDISTSTPNYQPTIDMKLTATANAGATITAKAPTSEPFSPLPLPPPTPSPKPVALQGGLAIALPPQPVVLVGKLYEANNEIVLKHMATGNDRRSQTTVLQLDQQRRRELENSNSLETRRVLVTGKWSSKNVLQVASVEPFDKTEPIRVVGVLKIQERGANQPPNITVDIENLPNSVYRVLMNETALQIAGFNIDEINGRRILFDAERIKNVPGVAPTLYVSYFYLLKNGQSQITTLKSKTLGSFIGDPPPSSELTLRLGGSYGYLIGDSASKTNTNYELLLPVGFDLKPFLDKAGTFVFTGEKLEFEKEAPHFPLFMVKTFTFEQP
jgi:hypothetical protein